MEDDEKDARLREALAQYIADLRVDRGEIVYTRAALLSVAGVLEELLERSK